MKTSSAMPRHGRLDWLRPFLLPGLILVVGLMTTAGLLSLAHEQMRQAREQQVGLLASKIADTIEERLRDNVLLLRGAAALSGRMTLTQEGVTDIQPGFVLFLPVYHADTPHDSVAERRANLLGWIYAPLHMHDLLQGVLQPLRLDCAQPGVQLTIDDGEGLEPATRLFTAGTAEVNPHAGGSAHKTRLVDFGWHQWSITVAVDPLFMKPLDSKLADWIGISGLTTSLLMVPLVSLAMQASRRTNRHLAEQERTRKALIDSLPANIALLDAKGGIVEVNDRWLRFREQNGGGDRGVDLGRNYLAICDDAIGECADEAPAVARGLRQVIARERDTFELEYPCHAPDQQRWFRLSATRLESDKHSDAPVGIAVMHVDITERKQAELRLEHIAYHDPLTGVLSLTGLTRGIAQRLSAGASNPDAMLVMLDVRNLRDVNDAQGYALGDQLLIGLGRRLQEQIGPQGLVGRVGGDEFGLFLRLQPGQEPHQCAAQLSVVAEQPFLLEGVKIAISIDIGYTQTGEQERPAQDLLREAEQALFEQRATKLSAPVAYTQALGRHVRERVEMTHDLRIALDEGQLELHFQPKVDLQTGQLIACEALLRWNHPERGLQPPPKFIPVAEQSQLIVPIGDWVLREACRHLHQWRSEGLDVVRVAVNVSLIQLALGDFPQRVRACLDAFDVVPGALTIEITESVFERESSKLLRQLQALRRMGIRLSLDDFGTGYSSLVYLQKYPFDEIKVDRAFVSQVLDDAFSREVVSSVLGLATAIGAEVVAEGIESNAERDELVKLGCRMGQGYYFSMPLGAEDFRWLLQQRTSLPLSAAASG